MKSKHILKVLAALLFVTLSFGAAAASKKPVESVRLDGPEEMYTGTSVKIGSTVLPKDAADRRLRWESSDTDIATVKSDGTVRAKKAGTVTVTAEARDGSGIRASVEIRVIEKVSGIRLEETAVKLLVGSPEAGTATVGYTVMPESAFYRGVTWTSSDEKVVTVDANGTLRAVGGGTAKVTCKTADPGSKAKATLNVTVGQPVSSIVITNPPSALNVGASVRIEAEALPRSATERGILYASGDTDVFTVEKGGTIHARGTGTATLTCTAKDGSGVTETLEITVIRRVTGIRANKTYSTLITGQTKRFTLKVTPEDATDPTIAWSTSDPSVATVDSEGYVTAAAPGECTLYGKAVDGSGKEIKLPLTVEPILPVRLSGFGQGPDSAGILVMRFQNLCKKLTIREVFFDYRFMDVLGNGLSEGSGSVEVSVSAGSKSTVMATAPAPDETARYAFTLTGVTFSDGTTYTIPVSERVTSFWA